MNYLRGKRVLLTGGHGFLGSRVAEEIKRFGPRHVFNPGRYVCDFTKPTNVEYIFASCHPEVVIHLAGNVGGIEYNQQRPGTLFYDNLMMGMNVLDNCRRFGVRRVILVGTVCSYPTHLRPPLEEVDLFDGVPEGTNKPYGVAKREILTMAQAYQKQYNLDYTYLILSNLYGPGNDSTEHKGHVIGALINKFVTAVERGFKSVTVWGTGTPIRDFLYVDDAAEAILKAANAEKTNFHVNVGSGEPITIMNLAHKIAAEVGFDGEIKFDKSKPDGQAARFMDHRYQVCWLKFQPKVLIDRGLAETVEFYRRTSVPV